MPAHVPRVQESVQPILVNPGHEQHAAPPLDAEPLDWPETAAAMEMQGGNDDALEPRNDELGGADAE